VARIRAIMNVELSLRVTMNASLLGCVTVTSIINAFSATRWHGHSV